MGSIEILPMGSLHLMAEPEVTDGPVSECLIDIWAESPRDGIPPVKKTKPYSKTGMSSKTTEHFGIPVKVRKVIWKWFVVIRP